jgi:hypothetical protein
MKKTNNIFTIIGLVLVIGSLIVVILNNIYMRMFHNKVERVEEKIQSMHPSWDIDQNGINDCEKEGICDNTFDYSQPREFTNDKQ